MVCYLLITCFSILLNPLHIIIDFGFNSKPMVSTPLKLETLAKARVKNASVGIVFLRNNLYGKRVYTQYILFSKESLNNSRLFQQIRLR